MRTDNDVDDEVMHCDPLWNLSMEQDILEPEAVAEFTRLERLRRR